MKLRKAYLTEVEEVRKWINDTASWLKEKNISQWERFLNEENTEICLRDYNKEKLYILENDSKEIIGSMSFGLPEDIDVKLWDNLENAYYIHRLVISKEFRGFKKGEFMLEWAKNIATEEKKELRLNCVKENKFLFDYYINQGFLYVGEKLEYHLFKYN